MSGEDDNRPLDFEAEICSLAVVGASVVLSFVGTNGERVSVTMPPIMLDQLAQSIAGAHPHIAKTWSPSAR